MGTPEFKSVARVEQKRETLIIITISAIIGAFSKNLSHLERPFGEAFQRLNKFQLMIMPIMTPHHQLVRKSEIQIQISV